MITFNSAVKKIFLSNLSLGQRLSCEEVLKAVDEIHDGKDIAQQIRENDFYVVKTMKLPLKVGKDVIFCEKKLEEIHHKTRYDGLMDIPLLVIDHNGSVIDGNHRNKVLHDSGLSEFPCLVACT